ncbi:MAG: hypothetical protein QXL82_01230 [Candidatus Aenigmatarchaeota archaeon]
MEILNEKYLTKYEVLEIIKEDVNNPLLNSISENIKMSMKKEISVEKIEEARKQLKELGLNSFEINLILDYLPQSIEDLNILFGKNIKLISEDKQKKIVEIINNL